MNHHTPEEWLLYMDDTAPPELADALRQHAASCPECAAELEAWKRSASRLRKLAFPAPYAARGRAAAVVRLALAASIALVFGFALGRMSQPSAAEIRQAVAAQMRNELRQDVREEVGALNVKLTRQRANDRRELFEIINGVRDQNMSDCLTLRRDLETAVSEADNGLRQNSRRITAVADAMLAQQ